LESARSGEGRIALVYGEAGIGKTALLTQFTRLHAREARLFWGACDPLSTPRPLAPLLDIAWTQGGQLAGRIAGRSIARGPSSRLSSKSCAPPSHRAIVVIEDLHWADEATLDLVKFLGRRAQRTSALLVLTWRDDGMRADHPLRASIGELPRQVVRAHPASGALAGCGGITRRQGAPEHRGSSRRHQRKPLLRHRGARQRRTGRSTHRARRGPRSGGPVAAAGPRALRAGIGRSLACRAVSARDGGRRTFAALDELLGSGILSLDQGAVAFRHELARRAIEDTLPPLRGRELHARILAALHVRGEDPAQLARLVHHAAGAGDAVSVLRLAPSAGEHASRLGAHREAEAHFSMALRHCRRSPPAAPRQLLEARAYECYLTDRMQDGIDSCSAARALWARIGDRAREGNCLCWLSRMAWYTARTEEAHRYGDLAIETLEALPPGPELAMAWVTRAGLYASANDGPKAIPSAEKALRLARTLGNREIEAHALNMLGRRTSSSATRRAGR